MPSVQPKAAKMLARLPSARPVETVNTTPVPGMSTTMNEVTRKSGVIMGAPLARIVVARELSHAFTCPNGIRSDGQCILLCAQREPAFDGGFNPSLQLLHESVVLAFRSPAS